ncbi:uncharacterized protein PAC_13426 [Phialocephala subalpina]|uniref:Uncharacterized protein n=1 Tax=Phialocephala subalpina TaxID=576137 RepID=A0A1L7XEQ7_9HELO|nr:uncharacterized protein PAC_13426 [Phialocephala subalpina]
MGLFFPLVPIAVVFPPSAILVVGNTIHTSPNISVPTYDFGFRGNTNTEADLAGNLLFILEYDGDLRYPKPYLNKVMKAAAMSGSYLQSLTPCGSSNCTYQITMPGPEFACRDDTTSDLPTTVTNTYGNATSNAEANTYFDNKNIQYIAAQQPMDENNITFVLSGFQTTDVVAIQRGYLLNSSYLASQSSPFPPFYNNSIIYPDNLTLPYGQNVSITYREANAYAIFASIRDALSGAVTDYDIENQFVANIIIFDTPMASYSTDNATLLDIPLSASILQSLLQNITISLLTLSNNNISTKVITSNYINQYQFHYPYLLAIPYALTLVGAFVFIIMGMMALVDNGISASSGGFLQLLCATRGSSVLNEMTRGSSLGGDKNVGDGLRDLVVRYGELRDERKGRRAGFGVESEVWNLVREGTTGDIYRWS